jgi:hypothetical protein
VKHFATDDLVILMTFARNEHQVISASLFDRLMNGFAPIRDLLVGLAGLLNFTSVSARILFGASVRAL